MIYCLMPVAIGQAVQKMVECLESYPELGAVALWFGKGRKITVWLPHISIQCSLFRRSVFAELDFTKHVNQICTCQTVKQQIESMGLKIQIRKYLSRRRDLGVTQ